MEDELGLPISDPDPTSDPFAEEYTGELETIEEPVAVEAEAPEVEVEAEAPVAEEVTEPDATDDTPAEEVAVVEEEATITEEQAAEGFEFGGRIFKTKEAAEASAKETQAAYTRGQQELRAKEAEYASQMDNLRQEMIAREERTRQELAQQIQLQQLEMTDPEQAAQVRAQVEFNRQLQERVAAETSAAQQQQQSQMAEWQQRQELQMRLDSFYAQHPDARQSAPVIANVIADFASLRVDANDEEGDWAMDADDPQVLEVAYEIANEPVLRERLINMRLSPTMRAIEVARNVGDDQRLQQQIRLNPAYAMTDSDLDAARQILAMPNIVKATEGSTDAQKAAAVAAKANAMVEPGNAGSDADAAPGDDWDAINEWKKESASVLNF